MENEIRDLLTETLKLGERGRNLVDDSALLGSIPEMDSMAVVTLVTVFEEQFEIEFDDEDINANSFATFGALCSLVENKLATL